MDDFQQRLYESLAAAEETSGFSQGKFFKSWFRQSGRSYYFLFKKNLSVTNIQFAELLALVQAHLDTASGEALGSVQFFSTEEFYEAIRSLADSLPDGDSHSSRRARILAELYSPLLRRAVVVKPFFGSCSVFLPYHLDINLEAICAESGYIHSCGPSVFVRRVDKSLKSDFFRALQEHLPKSRPPGPPPFFVFYAHEDFTEDDRGQASDLRHGLDDVKIHVEKFYMSSDHLVTVFREMQTIFEGRLKIPNPGSYLREHVGEHDRDHTLWLVLDHNPGGAPRRRGEHPYFICYDQQFLNENPFHIFDENKPAWIAHTTIPHTLLGAMINLTRPFWRRDQTVICDPFVGSGTTWLEAQKFSGVDVLCSDLDPVAVMAAKDNAQIFSMNSKGLQTSLAEVSRSLAIDDPTDSGGRTSEHAPAKVPDWLDLTLDEVERWREKGNLGFPDRIVNDLESRSMLERLQFYIGLRAIRRHQAGFERGSRSRSEAFDEETVQLVDEFKRLLELRQRPVRRNRNPFTLVEGRYSPGCTLDHRWLRERSARERIDRSLVVRGIEELKPESADIVIADPPYGFNTDDDREQLARLYAMMIDRMVRALRSGGQLVLCLPERSRTGRALPFFTQREIVTQQVLLASEQQRRRVLREARSLPEGLLSLRPPYYWESEKALRRAILHFHLD